MFFHFGTKIIGKYRHGMLYLRASLSTRHNCPFIIEIRRPCWASRCNVFCAGGIVLTTDTAPTVARGSASGLRQMHVGLGECAGTGRGKYRSGPRRGGRQGTTRPAERGDQNVAGERAG